MSPVHVEYLRNMGVKASLSISLVQNGRLWGLIACHHMAPRYVALRQREMDEFIGRVVSLKLIQMTARNAPPSTDASATCCSMTRRRIR